MSASADIEKQSNSILVKSILSDENMPPFNGDNAMIALLLGIVFYSALFFVSHRTVMMACSSSKNFQALEQRHKLYYSSCIFGMIFAAMTAGLQLYCMIFLE